NTRSHSFTRRTHESSAAERERLVMQLSVLEIRRPVERDRDRYGAGLSGGAVDEKALAIRRDDISVSSADGFDRLSFEQGPGPASVESTPTTLPLDRHHRVAVQVKELSAILPPHRFGAASRRDQHLGAALGKGLDVDFELP